MAKKQWTENGTDNILTSTLQQTYWGTDANTGHTHKSTDVDGDCPKIALSDSVSDYITGTFGIDVSSTYFTTPLSNETAYYTKIGNVVFVTFPDLFGHHLTATTLQLTPNGGDWPSDIIPSTPQLVDCLAAPETANVEVRAAYLNIPSSTSSNIIAAISDASAIIDVDHWGNNNTQAKGIYRRTLSWYVD